MPISVDVMPELYFTSRKVPLHPLVGILLSTTRPSLHHLLLGVNANLERNSI